MELRVRHRTGIEPAVDNFRCTFVRSAAFAAPLAIVDKRTVEFYIFAATALFRQFSARAYNMHLTAFVTYPHRQRRSPISVAGNTPVNNVFQEVAHTSRPDCRGNPIDGSVCFE